MMASRAVSLARCGVARSRLALCAFGVALALAFLVLYSQPALGYSAYWDDYVATHGRCYDAEDFLSFLNTVTCSEDEEGGTIMRVISFALNPAVSLYAALSQPGACVVCSLLATVLKAVKPIGSAAFEMLVIPSAVLLAVGFSIALVVGAGKVLLSPSNSARAWSEIALTTVRFLIALMILGGAATLTTSSATSPTTGAAAGASSPFDVFYTRLISPMLGTSISLGMVLLDSVTVGSLAGAHSPSASGPGGPLLEQARSDANRFLSDQCTAAFKPGYDPNAPGACTLQKPEGVYALMIYASSLHLIAKLGMAQGIGFIRDAANVDGGGARWIALIAGVIVLMLFAVFMIVAGLRLLDPLIRIVVVLALAPLLVSAWVFAPTRNAAKVGLRVFVYAFFFFIIAGLVYGIAFSLITGAARSQNVLSLEQVNKGAEVARASCSTDCPQDCPSAVQLVEQPFDPNPKLFLSQCYCVSSQLDTFPGLARCLTSNGGALVFTPTATGALRGAIDITAVLVAVISLLLAQSIIALSTSLSGTFADFAAGESIAQGAESQMRGVATSSVHTAVYAGMAVGKGSIGFFRGMWNKGGKIFGG